MNSPTSWLCLCSLFVPAAVGVGLALALHPRARGRAFLVGYGLPPLGLVALYGLYLAMVRATPCEPAGSLACGETTAYALVIFLVGMAVTLVVGAMAQLVLFFVVRARSRATR